MSTRDAAAKAIRSQYHPEPNTDLCRLINTATFDLHIGPIQPCDDFEGDGWNWPGFVPACDRIRAELELPSTLWYDVLAGELLDFEA